MELFSSIDLTSLSEDELIVVNDVRSALYRLAHLVDEMRETLNLFNHCLELSPRAPEVFDNVEAASKRADAWRKYGRWKEIPCKNGALIIYDFYKVMQTMNLLYRGSPKLVDSVDSKILKESNNMFGKFFPDFGLLRNAAAHQGEHSVTAADIANEGVTNLEVAGIKFSDGLTSLSGTLGSVDKGDSQTA
jgi:hypothetical protein